MAHARRKFDEALKVLPSSKRLTSGVATMEGLQYCNQLYRIERDLKELSSMERYEND
ncbi:IS66 family transposase [Heyndrickxia sporothermodurans]